VRTDVLGTYVLLQRGAEGRVPRFVQISTDAGVRSAARELPRE